VAAAAFFERCDRGFDLVEYLKQGHELCHLNLVCATTDAEILIGGVSGAISVVNYVDAELRCTNQNTNLLLRQYFPEKNLSAYSQSELDRVAQRPKSAPHQT
jgi:hypothetical protein